MSGLPKDIADLVTHWLRENPEGEAVRYGDQSWTWTQFADRIQRNAAGQLALGLRAGDRVAYLDKNHPACLETTLACALIGTANAVVNFRLAAEEIAYIINDAQATVLFVGTEFLPVVRGIRDVLPTVRTVVVVGGEHDEYADWLAAHEPIPATAPGGADDCFVQLYTSGTTGFPKGVMLTRRGLTAHTVATAGSTDVGSESVVLAAMPLFHVGGSSWALYALFHGARIVVLRDVDPVGLLDELIDQRITHVFLVPAVFGFLLRVPDVAQRDYANLRTVVYGASPMPLPLLRRCLAVFPCGFQQVYGMTEASGAITVLSPEDHRDRTNEHRLASAGLPMDGVELTVVDPVSGQRLGPNVLGEVWVRTEQLMSGYWRQPEATEAALTADGWLRSGDAGYLDSDGYLYVSDRIKDMIISGGENVYPAEIERVLAEHPNVADVAVIGVPDDTWGEVGKAIVVPAPGVEIDAAKLLAYCKERLASYKCPKSVAVVDSLPRNAAGKILKRELRDRYRPNQSQSA